MAYGAGYVAALAAGASEIVDPRSSAAPAFIETYKVHPHIGQVLPALGYGTAQLQGMQQTINAAAADVIVCATPIDLARLLRIEKLIVRARCESDETGEPTLSAIVDAFVRTSRCERVQ